MAGKRVLTGARGMAQPGAAIGAAAGGLHGALTNDPNNPNEGRMGRILSGALGGAAMGAGAGGAYGAGKAHVGNLTRAAANKGRMQGFVGGVAAGAAAKPAADAVKSTVQNVTKGFADRGAQQAAKQTAVEKSISRHQRNMARKTAPASAAPASKQPSKNPYTQDPYYNPSSEFYGGPEAAAPGQNGPSMMGRIKGKVQDIRQNRAASHAAEQEARSFVDKGQWKTSSPGFWSGFVSRSNGEI
jgi:hypothetical protein